MNPLLNNPGSQFHVGTGFIWSAQTRLMKLLAIRLGCQKTTAKSLVMRICGVVPPHSKAESVPTRSMGTIKKRRRVCALHIKKQSGLSMIEVLVTLVILMVGLLGLAGLQMQGLRSEMESYQRVQALILMQDMVGRINANSGNRNQPVNCTAFTELTVPTRDTCEWGNVTTNVNAYVADNIGTGDTQPAVCTALAVGQPRDTCEWSNALKGAGETSGGVSVGAMIGGRGCIRPVIADVSQISVQISVAWQGMGSSFQATNTCGQGAYGGDTLRRVIGLTTRIGNLTN